MIFFGFKGDTLEGRARNAMNITRSHQARTSHVSELLVIGTRRAAFDRPGRITYTWALIKDHKDAVFSSLPLFLSVVFVITPRPEAQLG